MKNVESPGLKSLSLHCSAAQDWEPRRPHSGLVLGMEGMAKDAWLRTSSLWLVFSECSWTGVGRGADLAESQKKRGGS